MNYAPSLPCIHILAWSAPLSDSIGVSLRAEWEPFVFIRKCLQKMWALKQASCTWAVESSYSLSCWHIFSNPIPLWRWQTISAMMDTAQTLQPSPRWPEDVVLFVRGLRVCAIVHMIHIANWLNAVVPGCWSPGCSDHSTPRWLCRRQWRSVGVKLMDKHSNKRKRSWQGCIHRRYATPPEWQHLLFHLQLLRVWYEWSPSGCCLYSMTGLCWRSLMVDPKVMHV